MQGMLPSVLLCLLLTALYSVQFVYTNGEIVGICPYRCHCSKFAVKTPSPYVERMKARCGEDGMVHSVEELMLSPENLTDIINLDLSGNNITRLRTNVFPPADLQKLDLSKNKIEYIDDGAFLNLVSLKRLDLSSNKLRFIARPMFDGMINLEKLKLGDNFIRQVKEGVFDRLLSLKTLDLSDNPLLCDCELWWLATWANNMSIKLSPMPKCSEPADLRDKPLRKLMAYSHQCSWSELMPPLLELSPSHDQVVFEGDSLKLECKAPNLKGAVLQESSVSWFWAGISPAKYFPSSSIEVENNQAPDSGILESTLIIKQLNTNHTGEWNCDLISNEGNHSSSVSVIVISSETKYCQPIATKDNKGEYFWPKTVAGHVVELPCTAETNYGSVARNNCTLGAQWMGANTSGCSFISQTTRILQQYAKMNLSAGRSSVNESATRLHNYTIENKHSMTDPDDIVFISRTINNYLEFLQYERNLGTLLLELISLVMDLDAHILSEAQMRDRSCTKLLSAIETIAQYQVNPFHGVNMLVERCVIPRESFLGMTCTWWNSREGNERLFQCSTSNTTSIRVPHDKILEASIQIPASLFHQLELKGKPSATHQIMVSIYDNAKLFPTLFNLNRTISSPIVGAKLVGVEVRDLVEPAYIMLGGLRQGVAPAWWDEALGDWVVPPCRPSHLLSDLLVTKCHHLGYFALISDIRSQPAPAIEQAPSRMSSPAVFVGTFVGATCLFVAAFTYAVCHSAIQMSDKMKHALANSWIAIASLSMTFNIGMYQTEEIRICQAVGLLLHYLTLCSLFWLAVSINGMHRSLGKLVRAVSNSSDVEESGPQVVGQPLVGLYLVGWGVSALLVGLSGAVNPMGYAAPTYCTLGPGPGFIPVLVPVSALFVFIFTRSLMVRSAAVEKDSNVQLSEGTQATDLELLETGLPMGDRGSIHSVGTPSSQVEDLEHPPYVQLKAFLIVTALFTLGWTCAALSVIKPFRLPHEETFFSVAYAVFIIVLGSFVVFFYCFSRSDVRSVWFTLKHIKRSRNVTDMAPPPIINSSETPTTQDRKSISPRPEPQGEISNQMKPNFVDLHRRQYQNNVVTEPNTFYNPHQSIVARKFFKKQRRKRNNLNNRRRGAGDGVQISPDNSELFHLGSKVNNTNIHVEPPTPRSNNRNILGNRRPPLERLVIGAESCEPTMNNDGSVKYASVASECCSCLVSEAHSVTDCTRDITSEHSSRSSHLYATVAPDFSPPSNPRLTIDLKNEAVHLKLCQHHMSDDDKRETSV